MRQFLSALAAAAILASGSFHLAVAASPTPTPGSTNDQLQQAEKQKQLLEQVRQKLGQNIADALTAQDRLTQSLHENAKSQDDVSKKIDDAKRKLAELQAQLDRLDREIAATEKRITLERKQMRSIARSIYVEPTSVIVSLAEVRSLGDLVTRISDLSSAGARATLLKQKLQQDENSLKSDRQVQQDAKDKQVAEKQSLDVALAKLVELQRKQEAARASLADKIAQTQSELKQVDKQSADVAQQITDLLQQQQEEIIAAGYSDIWAQVKVWQEANPMTGFPTSAGHSKKYRFVWPEPNGTISQGFGPAPYWFEPPGFGFPHFHSGIDLVEPEDSPVLAADDGVVVLVGSGNYGYGNYVVIAHANGLATLYGHLNHALVKVGDKVNQSQPIGLEGSTGNSTGAHCHFELRINGTPDDPSPFLPPGAPSPFKG